MSLISDVRSELVASKRAVRRRMRPSDFKEAYIGKALAAFDQPTYLEIGVRKGESFRAVQATRKIGIDPEATDEMAQLRPGEEYFVMTSDEFFANEASRVLRPSSIHVALIDGLHELRQVARDLLNVEGYMRADGIVFFDDFNPPTREMAEGPPTGRAWNGDVWKMAPFLRRARPDLSLFTIDADHGVGVLTGFGGIPTTGGDGRVIEECKALDFSSLERDRGALLGLMPRERFGELLTEFRRG